MLTVSVSDPNQLDDLPKIVEPTVIETVFSACKADVLATILRSQINYLTVATLSGSFCSRNYNGPKPLTIYHIYVSKHVQLQKLL